MMSHLGLAKFNMNWYKRAQQQYLPFYNPATDIPMENRNAYEQNLLQNRAKALQELTIEEFIEDHVNNEAELYQYFEELGLDLHKIDGFPNARPVYIFEGRDGNTYVIDEFPESPDIVEARGWVDRIDEMYLGDYVEALDSNEDFWRGVGAGYKLYHGTNEENLEEIQQNGLEARNVTRGMSNRGTGASVFTSPDPGTAEYSYDTVIEIDVGQMKADGYMPQAGGEEPLEESDLRSSLAYKLGLEDYYSEGDSSDGLASDTVIFYGGIPSKYLRVLE